MKKWHIVSLSALAFFTLNTVCKTLTGDFSLEDLTTPAIEESSWNSPEKPDNLDQILQQKFTYLGKGKQAYAFVSEDGLHVLKVFKPVFPTFHYHLLGKSRKISFSKIPGVKSIFRSLYAKEIEEQRNKDFKSYVNSFIHFPKETQLEYLHLASTSDLNQKISLFDKIGVLRSMDADKSCFLLQKRADLLYPSLLSYIKQGKLEKAKELLSSLAELSFQFVANGIDSPTTVEKNIGCVGLQAILIDVGRVLQREAYPLNGPKIEDMDHCVHHMRKWLDHHFPPLREHLEDQVSIQKERLRALYETSI